ncbi:sce7726 family protein [Vreelandella janggokensis]|uniref:sce7726 family protein n=1 Tax=Vreelandella janggokensis TaxID=370767 RepID=UPI0028654528|nr:sce7726 family protein [Halomonas janggokensis]MDR5886529.1 sce7726 family protein [Halomonas janggokensis]
MKEIDIKVNLADHITNTYQDYIMGLEVPFQFGERRADLVLSNSGKLTAYEIKTAKDNISRLDYQLDSYKSFFDYCFVVCEKTNLKEVRKKTPKSVGILVASQSSISWVRKSKNFKMHNKITLCSTLDVKSLKEKAKDKKIKSKHELCKHISSIYSLEDIRRWSRLDFDKKYRTSSYLVKIEKGEKISKDDIYTLTKKSPEKLVRRSS